MADIFVSYAKVDAPLAAQLAIRLEQLGFSDWYDRALHSGDDFRKEIARELEVSRAVVVLWSPASVTSDWVVSEAQRGHRLGKLVPVRTEVVAPENIPQPFDILHTVLVAETAAIEHAVRRRMKSGLLRPDACAPTFAQHEVAPMRITKTGSRPTLCIGRALDIERISGALTNDNGAAAVRRRWWPNWLFARRGGAMPGREARSIIIFGGPGLGKTTLALELMHDDAVVQAFGVHRYFIPLEMATSADDFRAAVVSSLGAGTGQPMEAVIGSRVGGHPALLILDNLETPWESDKIGVEEGLLAIAACQSVTILATIRGRDVPAAPNWTFRHELKPLDPAASQTLFLKLAPTISADDPHLGSLLDELGGVPLAIELIGLEAAAANSLQDVSKEWQRIGTALARRRGAADSRFTSLDRSLSISLNSSYRLANSLLLFSVLGALKNGADRNLCRHILGDDYYPVTRDLVAAGLAHWNEDRLDLLPPVREHALRNYPIYEDEWAATKIYYKRLADWLGTVVAPSDHAIFQRHVAAEGSNAFMALGQSIDQEEPSSIGRTIFRLHQYLQRAHETLARPDMTAVPVTYISRLMCGFLAYHGLSADARGELGAAIQYSFVHTAFADVIVQSMAAGLNSALADMEEVARGCTSEEGRFEILSHVDEMRREMEEILDSSSSLRVARRSSLERELDELKRGSTSDGAYILATWPILRNDMVKMLTELNIDIPALGSPNIMPQVNHAELFFGSDPITWQNARRDSAMVLFTCYRLAMDEVTKAQQLGVRQWLESVAEQGDPIAMHLLAKFIEGAGHAVAWGHKSNWRARANQANAAGAMLHLAEELWAADRKCKGENTDFVIDLLREARDCGSPHATARLEQLRSLGLDVDGKSNCVAGPC
ncbi:MAG TPA: TIR domain-containing protein [Rhodocyclaceae bacterium]|nr:TIR domain-containing protein [Rhodocyclaceae bacterium]